MATFRRALLLAAASCAAVAAVAPPSSKPPNAQCTSWCHWEWDKNCKSSQCNGCHECEARSIGRQSCSSSVEHDFKYEECDPTCQKSLCHMCLCKACVSCGGIPPVAVSKNGCKTAFSVSMDVGGRLELAISHWEVGEEVLLLLSLGTSAIPTGSKGDLDFGPSLRTIASKASGASQQRIVVPILGSLTGSGEPSKLWYTLQGHAPKYEPTATCRPRVNLPPPAHPPVAKSPPPPRPRAPPRPRPPAPVSRSSPNASSSRSPPAPTSAKAINSGSEPPRSRAADPVTHASSQTHSHGHEAHQPVATPACTAPPDRMAGVPSATALSSASWQLTLSGVRPCTHGDQSGAVWDVRIRRGGVEAQAALQSGAVRVNATATMLTIVGVRCPPEAESKASPKSTSGSGCSFALRMRNPSTNASTPWTPESAVRTSRPIAAVPSGGARLEVHFMSPDPVWARWEGSAAQQFQRFAASQMSVSERSVRVVERFDDGAYLILDLVPVELGLPHMLDRLLAALSQQASTKDVQELRRLLPRGEIEVLFTASGGVAGAYADSGRSQSPSFASLPVAVGISALLCLFLARSWRQQQQQYDFAGGKKPKRAKRKNVRQGPMDDDDDGDGDDDSDALSEEQAVAQVSVCFAPSCGEEMELILPTGAVETPSDLRREIWMRGNALMPDGFPEESRLRISFSDARGSERPLTSATLLSQVFEAGRIIVSCSTDEGAGGERDQVEKQTETASSDDDAAQPNRGNANGEQHTGLLIAGGMDDDEPARPSLQATRTWERAWTEPSPNSMPAKDIFAPSPPSPLRTGMSKQLFGTDDDEFVVKPSTKPASSSFAYPLD